MQKLRIEIETTPFELQKYNPNNKKDLQKLTADVREEIEVSLSDYFKKLGITNVNLKITLQGRK